MQPIRDDFAERVSEIDAYLTLLKRLDNPQVVLTNRATNRVQKVLNSDVRRVMKATTFLMVYSLVESGIRSAFRYLYEQIELESLHCALLRSEIRDVWIRQAFSSFDSDSVAARNFREAAKSLVDQVLDETVIALRKDRLPAAGNLNAGRIRRICDAHGVPTQVHFRAFGGAELETVRRHRNALAHGDTSFGECGRQYAVDDLIRIKQQAVTFVGSILRNVEEFVANRDYAARA